MARIGELCHEAEVVQTLKNENNERNGRVQHRRAEQDTKESLMNGGHQNLVAAVRSSHVPVVFHEQTPDARIVFRVLPGKRLT